MANFGLWTRAAEKLAVYPATPPRGHSTPCVARSASIGLDVTSAVRAYHESLTDGPPIRPVSVLQQAQDLGLHVPEHLRETLQAERSGTMEIDQQWVDHADNGLAIVIRAAQRKRPLTPQERERLGLTDEPTGTVTVKECLSLWLDDHKDKHLEYRKKMRSIVKRFCAVVGNKPVCQLTEQDFADWRAWVNKEYKKRSADWSNEQHSKISTFFKHVSDRKPSWGFPDALDKWLGKWEHHKHVVGKQNKRRLPVEVFNALLKQAEVWASADPEKYSACTMRGMVKRQKAQLTRLRGIRWTAILKMACQCSLDRVDIQRLKWEHLKNLDTTLPYLDFPWVKAEEQAGIAVERKTPLLPSTVKALLAIQTSDRHPTGFLFKTAQGGPYGAAGFTKCINRLLAKAGVSQTEVKKIVKGGKSKAVKVWTWSFKHFRNVASSLRKANGLPSEMSDAILGHVVPLEGKRTSVFYRGGCNRKLPRAACKPRRSSLLRRGTNRMTGMSESGQTKSPAHVPPKNASGAPLKTDNPVS